MAHISEDRVKETTTTTGTGALTLAGASTGFRAFSSVMTSPSDTCYYAITGGAEWEVGLGTYSASNTLTRTTVLRSSNSNSAVSFSAGTKEVYITLPGTDAVITQPDESIILSAVSSDPGATASGTAKLFFKSVSGRMLPKWIGPSGLDTPAQPAIFQNNVVLWTPTTATAGVWQGTVGSGAGTYTTQLPTTTNLYTSQKRARWANVVTTTNQVLGQRNTEAMFFIGSSAGQGGFFFAARCGFDVWTNGGRFFAGLHTATTVVSADPSALNNTVGFCVDAADNGAISFLTRSTSATKASTGYTITTNKGYDVYFFCAPNSSTIYWRIDDINAGTAATGTATATTPAAGTMLTAGVLASNAALTPVTSIQLGVNRIYVETDR